jgi:L-aminopeptidase/D-esterase-like protein
MPESAVFWAWPFEQAGEFGARSPSEVPRPLPLELELESVLATNTTLVVVATDAALSKTQAQRLAVMAQDGLARAIRPAHTPLDGDIVFALATGRRSLAQPIPDLARLGALAADCVSRAVARGVYEATDLGAMRSYRSIHGAPGAAGSK